MTHSLLLPSAIAGSAAVETLLEGTGRPLGGPLAGESDGPGRSLKRHLRSGALFGIEPV